MANLRSLFDVMPFENRLQKQIAETPTNGEKFDAPAVPQIDKSKILVFRFRDQYGRTTILPVNSLAKKFASHRGTKTLTRESIEFAHNLGFKFAQQIGETTAKIAPVEMLLITLD